MAGLSLADLQAVSEVANSRTFRGAAHTLAISPSALSHQIAAVERRLGI